MTATVTKTINIKANPDVVWEYVNDLSKWPEWAIHNVKSAYPGSDGFWLMDGPRGTSKINMRSDKVKGILDHDFIDPAEGHWHVPCRVVPGSEGSHLMITFTRPVQLPEEAFETGMKLLDEELNTLRKTLEDGPQQFTIEQIKAAHSKVKSGADFPSYVRDLIRLGVIRYETYLEDGHTDYSGKNGFTASSTGRGERLTIAAESNNTRFEEDLKAHQQGKSNFVIFCRQAADSGVEKWVVDLERSTCTYYDRRGREMLTEIIPAV